jgi:hypothetical protein
MATTNPGTRIVTKIIFPVADMTDSFDHRHPPVRLRASHPKGEDTAATHVEVFERCTRFENEAGVVKRHRPSSGFEVQGSNECPKESVGPSMVPDRRPA